MLKFLYLNQKKVPVPVPVKNLYEALLWIEKYLLRDGFSITRVVLDNNFIDILDEPERQLRTVELIADSRLEVQVDSVQDISIQTIDALRNLCGVLEKSLKPIAVKCWQAGEQGKEVPGELVPLIEDLDLILDMASHVEILVKDRVSITNIELIHQNLEANYKALNVNLEAEKWKDLAKTLLQNIEPLMTELTHELLM